MRQTGPMRFPRVVLLSSLVLAACPPASTETLAISPTTLTLQAGELRTVAAKVTTGDTTGAATGATWNSSDSTVLSVSSTGDGNAALQGLKAGTSTVTATLRKATATLSVTVTAAGVTLTRLELTPATPTLAKGTTLQLTATGVFSDGTTQDLTSGATWSSADAGVLTVANGLVSGLTAGTSVVTATKDGKTATLSVTVTAVTLTSIAVTPALPTLAKGTTQQLTATGTFSDATTQDLSSQVTWTSSAAAVTVDAAGLATAVGVGNSTVTATLDTVSGTTVVTVTAAVLTAIELTPVTPTFALGTTKQLTATGRFSDATTQDLTAQATWSSSAMAVATVDSAGLVTSVTTGSATLSATVGTVTGSTTVTVSAAQLASIFVTPVAPSLARGLTRTFTATGLYTDNTTQNLSTQVTWSSSAPAVASISNATGSEGLASAQTVGSTTITAALGAISASTTLIVTAATLTTLQVSPTTPTVPRGLTQQFTATGVFSDATTQNLTTQVTWSTGTAAVATISNATGSAGLLTAVTAGSSSVTATLGAVTGTTSVTVTTTTLTRIDVTPVTPSLARGRTLQLTATGVYSDATTQNLTTQVTWSSAQTSFASISNAAGSEGLLTAANVGQSTITATLNAVSGTQLVTVTAATLTAIDVTPATPSVAKGLAQPFTATGRYSDTTTQNLTTQVTWTTGTPATATVSNAAGSEGLATTLAAGTTTVVATLGTVTGNTTLTVTAARLVSIAISGAPATLARGRSANLLATGTYTDASTQNLTTQVTWASTPITTATVSNVAGSEGRVTAVAVGTATLTATQGTIVGQASIDVTAAVLESIAITPAAPSIAKGRARQLTATGTFSDATTQDLTTTVTWGSSAPSFLTVSNAAGSNGLASALAVGTGNITAQSGSITGTTGFTVTAAVLQSIAVTPANSGLVLGATQQFTATGTYSDATFQNLTTQVTWASSDPSLTISDATGTKGFATSVSAGSAIVSATFGTVSGSTTVSIGTATLVSIAVTPANPSSPKGTTRQFTATGTYSDTTTQNLTTQVTWTTGDVTFATISNTLGSEGRASAVAVGTTSVTATLGAVSGTTNLGVTPAALVSIAVTPANPSVAKGLTRQFTATGTYTDATTQNLTTQAIWSTTDLSVATISNVAGVEGLATGVAVGTVTVDATLGTVTGSTLLTVAPPVLQSIAITGAPATLAMGRTAQLTATGTYSDASTQNLTTQVTWAATPVTGATISNTAGTEGLLTAVATGTATLTATLGTITGQTTVNVTAAELVSIAVTPANPTVNVGATQQLTATGTYSDATTQNLTATATWLSQTPAFATVSAAGLLTAVAPGTTRIDATRTSITGSTNATVVFPTPTVAVIPADTATGVRSGATMVFTFSLAMDVTSLTAQTAAGACSGTLQLSNDNFATCLAFTAAAPVMTGNTIATLTPASALATLGIYRLRVASTAKSTNQMPLASTVTQANGFTVATDGACGATLMISQVYGAGGNAGANYNADFVELHNPGPTPVSLNGMALQYASSTGSSWSPTTLPNVSVPAGGYFLVRISTTGTIGAALAADHIANPALAMAGGAGKIALTPTTAPLPAVACPLGSTLDFVGYGAGTTCTEGGTTTATLTATLAAFRAGAGCLDSNINGADFTTALPAPRNGATTPLVCACAANETDKVAELDYCVLQFPLTLSVGTGLATPFVYARAYELGVTEPAGAANSIRAEIGYGPAGINPATTAGWVWTGATFNQQYVNDDEYQATFVAPAAGPYSYTGRFTSDGTNWTYCDLNGAGSNAGKTFEPATQLGPLTVTP